MAAGANSKVLDNNVAAMLRNLWWFVRLMRPSHQMALVLIFLSVRYGIVRPWLAAHALTDPLTAGHFLLVLLGGLLLSCGAVLINDYFDWHDDRIARPENVIVGRHFSRGAVILWHGILTSLGVLLLCIEAFFLKSYYLILLFPFVARLLWYYSKLYKQRFWLGVPLLFIFLFSVPLLPLLFEFRAIDQMLWKELSVNSLSVLDFLFVGMLYALFVSLLGVLRAFEKQIIYYAQRTSLRTETLPDRFGLQPAKMTVLTLKILLLLLVFFVLVLLTIRGDGASSLSSLFSLLYLVLFVGIFLVISTIIGVRNSENAPRIARFFTTLAALFVVLYPLVRAALLQIA
jgi:4-hydroxybenzoate-octaprenyltransferase